jgi:opacity protein-like surface antigen
MPYIFGSHMKKRLSLIVIVLISICLIPGPALANELGTKLELTVVPAASLAVLGLGGYWYWKNRLSYPSDKPGKLGYRGPGEFYYGGFAGVSLVNSANWSFEPIQGPTGVTLHTAAKNVKTDPGPVGGVKVGYFFDSIPYLGLEGEGSIASHNRPREQVTVKPAISNAPVFTEGSTNLIWTMALHIVGRYGFLPDKEVPFGRLQPYVGIGPGVGVLYFQNDSCKNFGLDTEVGVRYYFTKNIAALIEFKYIKQWDVQLGVQHLTSGGQRFISGNDFQEGKSVHFDFDNQKIVVGMEYHF